MLFHYLKGIRAKGVDYLCRGNGTNPLYCSRAEIFQNRSLGCGQMLLVVFKLELSAVLRMVHPCAVDGYLLSLGNRRANSRRRINVVSCVYLNNTVAVRFVLIYYSVDGAREGKKSRVRRVLSSVRHIRPLPSVLL